VFVEEESEGPQMFVLVLGVSPHEKAENWSWKDICAWACASREDEEVEEEDE